MKNLNRSPRWVKKRYMMLLEVLISCALIALCILPLITPHIAMIKEQYKLSAAMDLDHDVHLLYVDVLEQLHTKQIAWNQIQEEKPIPITDEMWGRIKKKDKPSLQGYFRFKELRHKPKKTAEWNAHWLSLKFYFFSPGEAVDKEKAQWVFPYELTLLRHTQEEAANPEEEGAKDKEKQQPQATPENKPQKPVTPDPKRTQ